MLASKIKYVIWRKMIKFDWDKNKFLIFQKWEMQLRHGGWLCGPTCLISLNCWLGEWYRTLQRAG